jgi:hypothetical protein
MLFESCPATQQILFLPVFYAALDPAQILTLGDLESLQLGAAMADRIARASLSLKQILHLALRVSETEAGWKSVQEMGPTLWLCIWPWLYFMHGHRGYLPTAIRLSDHWMYGQFPNVVTALLDTPLGHRWLPSAIQAGLITSMIDIATRFEPEFGTEVRYFLEKILPNSLVYYHVVVAIAEVLADIKEACQHEEFKGLGTFDDWVVFLDRAAQTIKLMKQLPEHAWLKVCDNLDVKKP